MSLRGSMVAAGAGAACASGAASVGAADVARTAAAGEAAALGGQGGGEAEFAEALAAHFTSEGFVASLPSSPGTAQQDTYTIVCERSGSLASYSGGVLGLTVTDCLSGIFQRQLSFADLAEVRRDAGMAEFAWGVFLRLVAASLRCEGGCSGALTRHGGACVELVLRFRLEAVVLVGRIKVFSFAAAPPPSPDSERYLSELQRFLGRAVAAARGSALGGTSGSLAARAGGGAGPAAPLELGRAEAPGGGPGAAPGRPRDGGLAAARGAKAPAAPKKRAGASLVDPHGRRPRGAGANPFQLSK